MSKFNSAYTGAQIDEAIGAVSGKQNATDNNLTTTAKTVVGAINEHESDISQLSSDKVDKASQASKTSAMTQTVGIDADGKLWTVPGGGGGGSETYELIETATLTEEVNSFSRSQEPNNTAYNFKNMYVRIDFPTSGSSGVAFIHFNDKVTGDRLTSLRFAALLSEAATHINAWQDTDEGLWHQPIGEMSKNGGASDRFTVYTWDWAGSYITSNKIKKLSISARLPIGTVVRIYGVRA